jgi:two-component system cell cycle response regulator DivK
MDQDWSNRTILVAEDDEISFKFLNLVLTRKLNVNVIWAINGQIAVDYCRLYGHIDLVLMDLQLPVVDGIEAIKIIKSFRPEIPIIVQTANAFNEEWERCFEAGCDDYINKPVNVQELLYRIENLMNPVAKV